MLLFFWTAVALPANSDEIRNADKSAIIAAEHANDIAFDNADIDGSVKCFAADIVAYGPDGKVDIRGKENAEAALKKIFASATKTQCQTTVERITIIAGKATVLTKCKELVVFPSSTQGAAGTSSLSAVDRVAAKETWKKQKDGLWQETVSRTLSDIPSLTSLSLPTGTHE